MPLPPESSDPTIADETVEISAVDTATEKRVGPYLLLEKLGAGGMGEVYLSKDTKLHRKIAIKTLPAHLTKVEDRVTRFIREARAASALNHPNIITIFDIGEADGKHYMATEYIDGETLRERMTAQVPINMVLDIAIQVASALAAAHEAGIVHRDIKPENVMLRPDGLVKVLDFGIAKLVEQTSSAVSPGVSDDAANLPTAIFDQYATQYDASLSAASRDATKPGMILGTATYMSPEQLRGLPVDARSDIFSLGVMLYEAIAGKPPFTGETQADKLAAILQVEAEPLSHHRSDVPPALDRIIGKALKKDRDARYQQVSDLLADLTRSKREMTFQEQLRNSAMLSQRTGSRGVGFTTRSEAIETDDNSTASAGSIRAGITSHKTAASLVLLILIVALVGAVYLARAGGGRAGITSIAVLPFTNSSGDPEKEYLSDGISESLINRLSKLPGLKVIANYSSARYKGKDTELRDVGRALDAVGVLTGRVHQAGDRLSISVELVDTRDSTQVWGDRYERTAADLSSVEAEISGEIAEKLRMRLTPGEQRELSAPARVKPDAYELLLKGRFSTAKGKTNDRKRAVEYLNQAIALDPDYALAHAELSNLYRSLVNSNALDPNEYLPKARQEAQKALELDERLAEGQYALANLNRDAWEWSDAERGYKRAIELNPNLALAHRWYAAFLVPMGRHDQAIAEIGRARELDPLSVVVNVNVGYVLHFARRYDEAIEALNKALEMDRNYPYTHLYLGYAFSAKRMYAEAIGQYQEVVRLGLDTPSTQISLGVAYAGAGDRRRAEAILKSLQTSKSPVSSTELAILHAALGDPAQAFSLLEKAYQTHDPQLQYIGVRPECDGLRSDARFQDMLRRVGVAL